jgi:transcriptional antiterminator Rof (Rho-off)
MTTDYRPIGCDQHSVLELLAMRQAHVEAHFLRSTGNAATLSGQVIDVLTRDRAEFLVLLDSAGGQHPVRLDRLRALFDLDGAELWRQESDNTGCDI